MANEKNLIPLTTKKAREIGSLGGKASGKAKKEKKLMSQIYAEYLIAEHDIVGKDGLKKLTGHKLLSSVMSKVLSRGDGAAVSMMKEIREATEGNKIDVNVNNELVNVIKELK
jgi:hypothetical protein